MVTISSSNDEDVLSLEFIMDDNIIICEGETTQIIANPNSTWTYTWIPEDFLVFTSEDDKSNPTFVGDLTTTYVVSVTDGISTISDTITVEVLNDLLELSFDSPNATACDGQTFLFVNNANHNSDTRYEWAYDTTFSDVIATEQFVTVVLPDSIATVYVRAEDQVFCGSNIASVDVMTIIPDFDFDFDNIDICVSNQTMVEFVNNDESFDLSITWDPSDNIVGDLNISSIIVMSSPNTSQVELSYSVTDSMGCIISDVLIVPIDNVLIPEIDIDGIDPSMICGSVELSVSSQEDDATYEWALDADFDEIVAVGSTVTIDLPEANNTVYVRASHPEYCDTTIDSEDINTANPDFDFDFNPINTCVGNTTMLDISDNDIDQGLSVVFEASNNITSSLDMFPLTITAMDGQDEVVLAYTASNGAGCSISDSLRIPIENELDISIAIDSTSCDGMFGVFRAMSNASEVNYEWSLMEDFSSVLSTDMDIAISLPGAQAIYLRAFTDQCMSDTVSATLPDNGFMIETDAPDRICDGDMVVITASDAERDFTIEWMDSDNIVSIDGSSITIRTIEGQESIVISYTATSSEGCVDMNTIEIPNGEIINPTPMSMVVCGTSSLSFTGGEGILDGDILWDFGVSSTDSDQSTLADPTFDFGMPGTYTVTLMPNRSTCRFETMTIDVVVPELIGLTSDNSTIISQCGSEDGATLGASNALGLPIVWVSNAGDTLAMSDTLNISSLQDITSITAISTDSNGCSESIVFMVDDFDPDLMVTFPDNPSGEAACAGENFALSIVGGEADWIYEWSPMAAIVSGQGTADIVANLGSSEDISVVITDPNTGCFTIITIPVDVIDLDLDVVADPDNEIFLGESVTISANSSGDIIRFDWDNGSTTMSQIVSPTETTTYTVTVTDANGCVATDQITITVIQPECDMSDIFIPTAFSPNDDGENDVLFVRSNFIEELDFQIVNRWGQEVFRSTNQRDGWNGRYGGTGKELEPDTYAYCLKVVCVDDREYIITGHVALYR